MNSDIFDSQLGSELTRAPLRFAEPIVLGVPGSPEVEERIFNATATMVDMGEGAVAITCAHVVSEFVRLLESHSTASFQIGQYRIDPKSETVSISSDLDLASFRLDETRLDGRSVRGGAIQIHRAPRWPPGEVKVGDMVSLGGYPGIWRQPTTNERHIEFDTFAIGGARVTSVQETRLVCQLERSEWTQAYGNRGKDVTKLGGLSGAPALVLRNLHWELAGIVTEHHEDFDLLYLTRADRILPSGQFLDG